MPTKFRKFACVALLAAIGLTGCSNNNDVISKPTNNDDKIVEFDEEIYNNTLETVYEGIREGTLPADVLDEVLYQFAVSIIGPYNHNSKDAGDAVTLKEAVASAKSEDKTKLNEFVKAHKSYWSLNEKGERNHEGDAADEFEQARVIARWNSIEKRIADKMYNDISSGTYSRNKIFSEKAYLFNLMSSLNKVSNPNTDSPKLFSGLLSPDIEPENCFITVSNPNGFLHRENYQYNYELEQDEKIAEGQKHNTYVEDKIIPSIYRELLVEQYLLDETYNTLGRSYARHVDVVSIKVNEKSPIAADYLVNQFINDYINAKPTFADGKVNNQVTLDTFKILSNAWKGVNLDEHAEAKKLIIDSKGFKSQELNGETYYIGTEYGDMMADYSKITDNPLTTDSTIEADFTGSSSYTKEVGKQKKENDITLKDYTESGWYIKNGGLSDLPEDIRSRLFNIGVANALDNTNTVDRYGVIAEGEALEYKKPEGESKYVALINGSYYLKTKVSESEKGDKDMLFYDDASKTYFIIKINEAASSSKLDKDGDNNYAKLTNAMHMEEIVAEITKVVANNDTYKTLSTKHWLEKSNLKYHDTKVYEYFKENYPELFE